MLVILDKRKLSAEGALLAVHCFSEHAGSVLAGNMSTWLSGPLNNLLPGSSAVTIDPHLVLIERPAARRVSATSSASFPAICLWSMDLLDGGSDAFLQSAPRNMTISSDCVRQLEEVSSRVLAELSRQNIFHHIALGDIPALAATIALFLNQVTTLSEQMKAPPTIVKMATLINSLESMRGSFASIHADSMAVVIKSLQALLPSTTSGLARLAAIAATNSTRFPVLRFLNRFFSNPAVTRLRCINQALDALHRIHHLMTLPVQTRNSDPSLLEDSVYASSVLQEAVTQIVAVYTDPSSGQSFSDVLAKLRAKVTGALARLRLCSVEDLKEHQTVLQILSNADLDALLATFSAGPAPELIPGSEAAAELKIEPDELKKDMEKQNAESLFKQSQEPKLLRAKVNLNAIKDEAKRAGILPLQHQIFFHILELDHRIQDAVLLSPGELVYWENLHKGLALSLQTKIKQLTNVSVSSIHHLAHEIPAALSDADLDLASSFPSSPLDGKDVDAALTQVTRLLSHHDDASSDAASLRPLVERCVHDALWESAQNSLFELHQKEPRPAIFYERRVKIILGVSFLLDCPMLGSHCEALLDFCREHTDSFILNAAEHEQKHDDPENKSILDKLKCDFATAFLSHCVAKLTESIEYGDALQELLLRLSDNLRAPLSSYFAAHESILASIQVLKPWMDLQYLAPSGVTLLSSSLRFSDLFCLLFPNGLMEYLGPCNSLIISPLIVCAMMRVWIVCSKQCLSFLVLNSIVASSWAPFLCFLYLQGKTLF